MNELTLIERIQRRSRADAQGLILGIGDDCAIFRPRAGQDLVFTTDFLIQDVHFRRDTHPAGAVGHKALARSLSDIAAMGAVPRFCLLSLALPRWADQEWIDAFYGGFLALARRTKTVLAGGDLSHAEKVICDVMVCGAVARGKALRRDGAHPGDVLYVSGRLGKPWQEHLRPMPRLALGQSLVRRATAAIDVSDGISIDLYRLCTASGVAASLDRLPIRKGSTLDQALSGGEDYELLFTLPRGLKPPRGVTRIGKIEEGRPGAVSFQGCPLPPFGYDHFRSDS